MTESDNNHSVQVLAAACTAAMHTRDYMAQASGMVPESLASGEAVVRMTIRQDMLNGHGFCHGGMIFSLADTAFAHACNNRNLASVALDCRIDFLRPVREGDELVAHAREKHTGKTTGLYEIEVINQHGKRVAIFQGRSFYVGQTLMDDGGAGDEKKS